MAITEIDHVKYNVNPNEFQCETHAIYNSLNILDRVGLYERLIALLSRLSLRQKPSGFFYGATHGGFIPINCVSAFTDIRLLNVSEQHLDNINDNLILHDIKNISVLKEDSFDVAEHAVVFAETASMIDTTVIDRLSPIILTTTFDVNRDIYNKIYQVKDTDLYVYVPNHIHDAFYNEFCCYIDGDILKYDNLINLCIMVKNAGPQFESMLNRNFDLIDRWTILDTGSTDSTMEIVKKVLVGKKYGALYEESFINFRDSRNRLLDLAGSDCKFNVMIDDTYVINGDLRGFLNEVRGDQFSDSFSLYIKSDDVEYGSNRISKSNRALRYKFKIHEVLDDANNKTVIVPIERAHILDERFSYMEERTMQRKDLDLKLLYEELEDDPSNSRTLYYLAQTYSLLNKPEKAFEYFIQRMNHPNVGFIQEKIDAVFEAARIANFKLKRPWRECEELYLKAYELDKSRPSIITRKTTDARHSIT